MQYKLGFVQTGILSASLLVSLLITDTLFEPEFATYAYPFIGSKNI
jgi:hypothetical protein